MKPSILQLHHLPNLITLLRLLLVWPTVVAILGERFGLALFLFLLAGISDALDGFLAKRFGWQSRLGAILDPIADKLLLVSCYWVTYSVGLLPFWFVCLILFRDLAILTGTALLLYRDPHFEIRPSFLSKLNTTLQVVYLMSLFVHFGLDLLPDPLLSLLRHLVVLLTLVSGLHYALLARAYL